MRGIHQAPSPQSSETVQIGMAIVLAAFVLLAATIAGAASLDDMLARRKPDATIDLATGAGAQLVKGEWRYSDTKIVEVDFKAAGTDGQPGSSSTGPTTLSPTRGEPDSTTPGGK